MKIEFYKKSGEKDTAREYPKILESEISDSRILEYIRYLRAAERFAIADTKDRSEVAGGGRKPWRQKGTGQARHGSRRSPIWVGGGITFGPNSERNFAIRMNKKERRAALLAAVYSKVKDKLAIGVSDLKFSIPKTKEAAKVLEKLPLKGKTVVFLPGGDDNFKKSFQNISYCTLMSPEKPDIILILSADSLLFTKESLEQLALCFSDKRKKDLLKMKGKEVPTIPQGGMSGKAK